MKRIVVLLVIASMLLAMSGCRSSAPSPQETQSSAPTLQTVQYIRTNGLIPTAEFPIVCVIRDPQQLTDYIAANNDPEPVTKVQSDAPADPSLFERCSKYNEAFFENNFLVCILLEQIDASDYPEVISATKDPTQLIVRIVTKTSATVYDNAQQCQILLEMHNEQAVSSPDEVTVYLNDAILWNGSAPNTASPESALIAPPAGTMSTPNGEFSLHPGGYSWSHITEQGFVEATIADQACRPVPAEGLQPVILTGSDCITLNWPVAPTSVAYTCWNDTVWQNADTPAEEVTTQGISGFTPKPGAYVYEIVATWENSSGEFGGTVYYYTYVIVGEDHAPVENAGSQIKDAFQLSTTRLTLYTKNAIYTFDNEHSAALLQMLRQLDYNKDIVCRCHPEITAKFSSGESYGLLPGDTAARCDQGQAELKPEQQELLDNVIQWAENTYTQYKSL